MTQNYNADCYGPAHVAQNDLQIIEDNFACLRSSFSGGTAPPQVDGQLWFAPNQDTLRVRTAVIPRWVGVMTGDANHKIWVYRNDAMQGWAIDTTSSADMLLAFRGGFYGSSGGQNVGSYWDVNVHQHDITIDAVYRNHEHEWWSPSASNAPITTVGEGLVYNFFNPVADRGLPKSTANKTSGSNQGQYTGVTGTAAMPATFRPIAAVGTMQYVLQA